MKAMKGQKDQVVVNVDQSGHALRRRKKRLDRDKGRWQFAHASRACSGQGSRSRAGTEISKQRSDHPFIFENIRSAQSCGEF